MSVTIESFIFKQIGAQKESVKLYIVNTSSKKILVHLFHYFIIYIYIYIYSIYILYIFYIYIIYYIYIHHWKILWSSYRKLAWVEFEPTTTEFCSDPLTKLSGHKFNSHSEPTLHNYSNFIICSVSHYILVIAFVSRHRFSQVHAWIFTKPRTVGNYIYILLQILLREC